MGIAWRDVEIWTMGRTSVLQPVGPARINVPVNKSVSTRRHSASRMNNNCKLAQVVFLKEPNFEAWTCSSVKR